MKVDILVNHEWQRVNKYVVNWQHKSLAMDYTFTD
ncbi:MAG: hypothetical protein BWY29_01001 [Microgenomates group bacterium ADurb.Bin238]|nr:MAG: hypothetical protein BWY29_01001 [Microgenomates group bacterium ADurb.Bin238]